MLRLAIAFGLFVLIATQCSCVTGWRMPDGGPLPDAGDGCPCADVQTQVWGDGELLLECVPHNAGVVGLCFGDGCCTWEP